MCARARTCMRVCVRACVCACVHCACVLRVCISAARFVTYAQTPILSELARWGYRTCLRALQPAAPAKQSLCACRLHMCVWRNGSRCAVIGVAVGSRPARQSSPCDYQLDRPATWACGTGIFCQYGRTVARTSTSRCGSGLGALGKASRPV